MNTNEDQEIRGVYEPVGVPPTTTKTSGRTLGIAGVVFGVLSTLILPLLFGLFGILLGVFAHKKGDAMLGITAITVSIICMIAGVAFSIYITANPELFQTNESMGGALLHMVSV